MEKSAVIDWSLIIAIGIAWGSSFMFIKISAPAVGPMTLVFYRLFIASLILTPIFIISLAQQCGFLLFMVHTEGQIWLYSNLQKIF